jgi:hypothetical protein
MVLSVAELQAALHDLFTDTARQHAKDSGFCQRERDLTGPVFAQALVFSLLHKPESSLEDFASFASQHLDVFVTSDAFKARFNESSACFLRDLFLDAFNRCFNSPRPALLPVLRRFNGVYLRDATVISLPDCLAGPFPGRTSRDGKPCAAIKLVLEVEVSTGQFTDASLLGGLANDKTAEVAHKPLPKGALLLEDMGFLCGERLLEYMLQGVYFLTRVPCWTAFFQRKARGKGFERLDVVAWLRQAKGCCVERQVYVFHEGKLKLRLLASRVPEEVAQARREAVRKEAKGRGRPVSQRKLELCEWNILVTNAPREKLSAYNGWEVRRVRWQIELVFKAFKSEGGIERTQARKRDRVLTELYAKLLAMVVQQWCLLSAGYVTLRHSLRRASKHVRERAGALLRALGSARKLGKQIKGLGRELSRCKIQKRRSKPSTFDRLADLDAEFRQLDQSA